MGQTRIALFTMAALVVIGLMVAQRNTAESLRRSLRAAATPACFRSPAAAVTQRPHIGRDRRDIGWRELGAAQGWHRAPVRLRIRYAVGDRPRNGSEIAGAP